MRGAAKRGAEIRTHTTVETVRLREDRGLEMHTIYGVVLGSKVVIAANAGTCTLSRRIGKLHLSFSLRHECGVYSFPNPVPLEIPTGRIGQKYFYIRHEASGLLVGGLGTNVRKPPVDAKDSGQCIRARNRQGDMQPRALWLGHDCNEPSAGSRRMDAGKLCNGWFITDCVGVSPRWTPDTAVKPTTMVSRPLPKTLNHVRQPIEPEISITDRQSARTRRNCLGVECRTEQVWVDRDVWRLPNASMCMIDSVDEALIETHWATTGSGAVPQSPAAEAQPIRMFLAPEDAYFLSALDVRQSAVVELRDTASCIEAFTGTSVVVAAPEYSVGDFDVVLAYPAKINIFSARENYNQLYTRALLVFCKGAVGSDAR